MPLARKFEADFVTGDYYKATYRSFNDKLMHVIGMKYVFCTMRYVFSKQAFLKSMVVGARWCVAREVNGQKKTGTATIKLLNSLQSFHIAIVLLM